MKHPKQNIQERLKTAQFGINNALTDSQLQSALAAYGYTAERLQEGQILRERAQALFHQQRVAYGNLSTATDALAAAQALAEADYIHYVKLARVAFEEDRGASHKLDLAVGRKRARAGWLVQAQQFYTNALADPDILSRLNAYGITQAKLLAGKQQVDAVDTSCAAQRNSKGEAQEATRVRDQALAELEVWMRGFRQIVRLALKDQPQYLEKLGVIAHTQ